VGSHFKRSKRPQGERRDGGRWLIVLGKEKVEVPESVSKIEDTEEVLYMQCRCPRHHEALLTPHDFLKGMEPWAKFVEPENKAGLSYRDHFKDLIVKDQRYPDYIRRHLRYDVHPIYVRPTSPI
jgi:hypothetical protein